MGKQKFKQNSQNISIMLSYQYYITSLETFQVGHTRKREEIYV